MENERDILAEKEGAPYHETGPARVMAFKHGWDAFKTRVLGVLLENKLAAENLTDFDKARPAQELILEINI